MEAVLATGRAEQRDCEKSHSSPWCQCKGQPSTQRQDESEPQQSTKHSRTVLIEQLPDRAQPTGTACMRRHQPVKHQGPRLIENTTPYLPMSTLPSHPLMLSGTLPATSRDKSWWLPVCQWPQQRCIGRCQRPSTRSLPRGSPLEWRRSRSVRGAQGPKIGPAAASPKPRLSGSRVHSQ